MADRAFAAWNCLEGAWGGVTHRANINRRDQSESEREDPADMMAGGPFQDPVWETLASGAKYYVGGLPGGLEPWASLGGLVATALDPAEGGARGALAVAAVENQL